MPGQRLVAAITQPRSTEVAGKSGGGEGVAICVFAGFGHTPLHSYRMIARCPTPTPAARSLGTLFNGVAQLAHLNH